MTTPLIVTHTPARPSVVSRLRCRMFGHGPCTTREGIRVCTRCGAWTRPLARRWWRRGTR